MRKLMYLLCDIRMYSTLAARFFSGNEQVDLARKIQEDSLYAIKKKEMETRNQLLKNPVKLKQLKELLREYRYIISLFSSFVYAECLFILNL